MIPTNDYALPLDALEELDLPNPKLDLDGLPLPTFPQCTSGTIVGINEFSREVILAPLTCGRWSCPDCSRRKAAKVYARMMNADPARHVVLTIDPKNCKSPADALERMKKALPKLMKWLRDEQFDKKGNCKKPPIPIEYAAIWELHANGYPHVHLATWGAYCHHVYLRVGWRKFSGGGHVWIERMDAEWEGHHHWTKYLLKTIAADHPLLRGKKLITFSQGYDRYPAPTPKGALGPLARWFLVRRPPPDVLYVILNWFKATVRDAAAETIYLLDYDIPCNAQAFNAYSLEEGDFARQCIQSAIESRTAQQPLPPPPTERQHTLGIPLLSTIDRMGS